MKLSNLSEALARDEIRLKTEVVNDQNFHIVTYMVASPDLWDVPNAIECRGITFNDNGHCVCRTMEKFFNLNENKYSQQNKLDFSNALAFDKLDGSMISVVDIDGKLFCKTKKSFYSTVAIAAQKYFNTQPNLQELSRYLIDRGYTPTFEYESPDCQIVIKQTQEKMTLLLARHIETGEYMKFPDIYCLYSLFKLHPLYYSAFSDINNLVSTIKKTENIEGVVIRLQSGQQIKIKSDWYLKRHRLTNYSERNIFDLILSDEIDDLMPLLETREGAIGKVNAISHRIAYLIKQAEIDSDHLVAIWTNNNMTLSDIGKQYSQHKAFTLAIRQFKNQEPDFKTYVIKHYRSTFSTAPLFWGFEIES